MAAAFEKPRDIVGGILVMALGAGFLWVGSDLRVGTSFRMGPGYFPRLLSWLVIGLGAIMTLLALRAPRVEGSLGHVPWRGVVLVIGAVVFFGLTLRGIGLAPAILVVVLATAWASRYASWRASVPLAVGLTVFCALLFIRGLGLPLPFVGPWLTPAYWSGAPPAPEPGEQAPGETAPSETAPGEAPAANPPAQQ